MKMVLFLIIDVLILLITFGQWFCSKPEPVPIEHVDLYA
jgi:hypothetical protein